MFEGFGVLPLFENVSFSWLHPAKYVTKIIFSVLYYLFCVKIISSGLFLLLTQSCSLHPENVLTRPNIAPFHALQHALYQNIWFHDAHACVSSLTKTINYGILIADFHETNNQSTFLGKKENQKIKVNLHLGPEGFHLTNLHETQ